MNNEIDLSKHKIRTDLAIETLPSMENLDTYIKDEQIKVTSLHVDSKLSQEIGKKEGTYITIEFDDVTDYDNREKIGQTLEEEIKKMLDDKKITPQDECLIIGLGNEKSTPDALGPLTIKNVLVTRHLFLLGTNVKEGIRKVSALSPGVMGNTGIETIDLIKNIVQTIKPSFVIVIDALAASSIERVNKTIQMTDSGIEPGSGVGNSRKEISEQILGIPVIAIGVPTVVDSSTIVSDTINYLLKHLSYIKDNYSKNKLIVTRSNYLEKIKNNNLSKNEKEEVIGMLGTLSEEEQKKLIIEVLEAINYNMIVTPKEIDYLIEKLSDVISSALNNALHKEITNY